MAFLRASRIEDDVQFILGQTLVLRVPQAADYAEWAELRAQSRAHLTPWEPTWSTSDLSRHMFRRRLRAYARDIRDDAAYPYFLFDRETGALVGGLTLSNVRRGSAQSASIGYWMGAPFARQGRMTEAVSTIVPFASSTLMLSRIEAATMPANVASIRVLETCGFVREGLAQSYLKINGRWEDHLLFSRIAPQRLGSPAMPKDAA